MMYRLIALCVCGVAVATRPDPRQRGGRRPERAQMMGSRSPGVAYAAPFAVICPLTLALNEMYWAEHKLGDADVVTWLVCMRKPLTGASDEDLRRRFMVTSNPFQTSFETSWTLSTLPHLRDLFSECRVKWKKGTKSHVVEEEMANIELGQCVRKTTPAATTTTATTTTDTTTTTLELEDPPRLRTLELKEDRMKAPKASSRPLQRAKAFRDGPTRPHSVACNVTLAIDREYFDKNGLGGWDKEVRLVCDAKTTGFAGLEREVTGNPFVAVYRTQWSKLKPPNLGTLLSNCRVLWRRRRTPRPRKLGAPAHLFKPEEGEQQVESTLVEIALGHCVPETEG